MKLNEEQQSNKNTLEQIANIVGIDPRWVVAVGMVESSLGMNQKSPTGAKGVFQLTSIAMKDLLLSMDAQDDDLVDMLCGVAFLWLLFKRHGSIEEATMRYCDPKDRDFYWKRVQRYIETL
jgi:membrane-bound lytic murein transglycosylase MltF